MASAADTATHVLGCCCCFTPLQRIIWGKWTLNHGQSCISPDYVLVHPSKKADLVAALKKHLAEFFGDAKGMCASTSAQTVASYLSCGS